jgi:hypothetical protein
MPKPRVSLFKHEDRRFKKRWVVSAGGLRERFLGWDEAYRFAEDLAYYIDRYKPTPPGSFPRAQLRREGHWYFDDEYASKIFHSSQ